jgi:seryl-tRNA synthetase
MKKNSMHSIKKIKKDPDIFKKDLMRRCLGSDDLDKKINLILELDIKQRKCLTELQELQAKRHTLSQKFGELKKKGNDEETDTLLELTTEVEALKVNINKLEKEDVELAEKLRGYLSEIPNLPATDTPCGKDERDNVEILQFGKKKKFSFVPKPHDELGKNLNLMDFERSAKLSGSRFVVLYEDLARLERALSAFMIDIHSSEYGYMEVYPPLLVQESVMFGTGQLPKFENDQFKIKDHNLWLIPTSEVALTNLIAEEILNEKELPLRFTAYTPCFRAEAGAAGRDTHGMIRLHQFGKVELVSITTERQSKDEHERMCEAAQTVLKRLDLPYRVMALCCGDMGFQAEKTYDLEVWLPSQNTYREISSCSRCSDFQAQRMNARYRSTSDNKLHFVHTLNGSGLAVGRTIVALLENYQNEDGSITIPDSLIPYMNGRKKINKKN